MFSLINGLKLLLYAAGKRTGRYGSRRTLLKTEISSKNVSEPDGTNYRSCGTRDWLKVGVPSCAIAHARPPVEIEASASFFAISSGVSDTQQAKLKSEPYEETHWKLHPIRFSYAASLAYGARDTAIIVLVNSFSFCSRSLRAASHSACDTTFGDFIALAFMFHPPSGPARRQPSRSSSNERSLPPARQVRPLLSRSRSPIPRLPCMLDT